jgi:hypothetical protein
MARKRLPRFTSSISSAIAWRQRHAEAGLNALGSIIQFENVGLRYGTGAETLSDLSFSLREGGFYF